MTPENHYWFRQAMSWRKRARAAELQRDKLLRRCSALDRSVNNHLSRLVHLRGAHQFQMIAHASVLRTVEDAQRVLARYHRGTNGKEMKQIVEDAQAFLRLITHPWEG